MTPRPILPPARLGILGGGQLGLLLAETARAMGYRITVLDPSPSAPARALADTFLCAEYEDAVALQVLAKTCAAVTTEFENVSAEALRYLAQFIPVSPSADCVAVTQDRIAEKALINSAGLPTAPYVVLRRPADLSWDLSPYLPGILKTARLGYDGKGQRLVHTAAEIAQAFAALAGMPAVLEKRLDLMQELSVIVARSATGEVAVFPVAENRHTQGILAVSILPARISAELAARAERAAVQLAKAMNYIGVLAVEFFVLRSGDLLVNELAPRPHNSGHATMEACVTSQFEQQVRTLCRLPLGATDVTQCAVMVNLLGDLWDQNGTQPNWECILTVPHAKLRLYGKDAARSGRKMGHYCVVARDAEAALRDAERIKQQLSPLGNPRRAPTETV
jgi:5-(carboxyamino)imidazole ribonucleotide synthase